MFTNDKVTIFCNLLSQMDILSAQQLSPAIWLANKGLLFKYINY